MYIWRHGKAGGCQHKKEKAMGNHGAGVCRRPGHPEEKSRGFWRLAETAAEGGQKPSRMYLENSIQKRDGKEKSFQEKKISSISTSEKQTSKKEAGMHAGKHAGRQKRARTLQRYAAGEAKQERAQGGCLGTKSR